jgi:multicomponent Na+:H+ antiporter subunit D
MGTALLGVSYAIFAKDTKRMLAFHTVSQLGFVMAAPIQIVAGFYGLTHGLVKSALFLGAGNLPSRQFKTLKHQPLPWSLWGGMAVASLSISGFPLLAGFGAKALTLKNLLPWQTVLMNLAAIGTAISFAKFLFLPMQPPFAWATSSPPEHSPSPEVSQTVSFESVHSPQAGNSGLWLAWTLLLGGLVVTNGLYWPAYTGTKVLKALGTLVLGWAIYHGIIRRVSLQLPRVLEEFDHLLGMMSVMLTLLFWLVLA